MPAVIALDAAPIFDQLHPTMREPVLRVIMRASSELGLTLEPFDAYRDASVQLANWQKGRNTAGEVIDPAAVVTNSRPGGSYHNLAYPNGHPCSLAIHLGVKTLNGGKVGYKPIEADYAGARKAKVAAWWSDGADALLTARHLVLASVVLLAEEEGLTAGGRWHTLQDWLHVEKRVTGATLEQIKAMLLHQGDIQIGGLRT